MSSLHFVAADEYRKRVIQLGEHPSSVYKVGSLGIDNIKTANFLSKEKIENFLNFVFGKRNLLVTFHPLSLSKESTIKQISELLEALMFFDDIHLIFTMPNSDTNGKIINKMIKDFCSLRNNAVYKDSLGQQNYFLV